MNQVDAIKIVLKCVPELIDFDISAEKIKDFNSYWYVTRRDSEGVPVLGGYAYVVCIETGVVFAVPGSMPAHFNLRSVSEDDAKEIGRF
jgi:hypothetical protein